jgi:hypothetical protein
VDLVKDEVSECVAECPHYQWLVVHSAFSCGVSSRMMVWVSVRTVERV